MSEEESNKLFWHRVKLLAIVGVFVAPFIGGWLALYVFELRPEAGNYGELVQPVRKIDWPPLQSLDGQSYEGGFGRKWSFLLFADGGCDDACRSNLFYMRQIRTLLGRDTLRLQNVLVSLQPLEEKTRIYLKDFPNMVVIENYRGDELRQHFQLPQAERLGASPKMYLVDPDQNLMMHYPATVDEKRVLEDLRKLMKLSQIG